MTDVLNPSQRSFCMSRIRGKNTKPEILLRHELWSRGLRYRVTSQVFGKPDILFIGAKVAVFVDGCFWHGCSEHSNTPKTNAKFWHEKLAKTKLRDELVNKTLAGNGYQILRFWEHEINDERKCCADKIESAVNGYEDA